MVGSVVRLKNLTQDLAQLTFLSFCSYTRLIKPHIKKLDIAINDSKTHDVNVSMEGIYSVQKGTESITIFS